MLSCHGREAMERWKMDMGTTEHHQNEATSALPAFLNWRKECWQGISSSSVFINPWTKCDFWLLPHPLLPYSNFPSRTSIFQILLYRANLDYSRRFEPILCRNEAVAGGLDFWRAGFKLPLSQPESYVMGMDCFALTAWRDILRKTHRKLDTDFAAEISSNAVCIITVSFTEVHGRNLFYNLVLTE